MWLIVALGVGLFGFIYFFTKPNNSTRNIDKYVSKYIDNSIELEFDYLDNIENIEYDDIYVGFNLKKLQRSKLSSVPNNQFTVYDSSRNKYFRVILVDSPESMKIHRTYILETLVKAKVNQNQLQEPSYGTKEKPIPILYLEIPKYKQSQNYYMIEKTPEKYRESVYYYLAYIMPKDEFKRMFKD